MSAAAEPFLTALRALANTGAEGFEGFVRDCFEEVLKQRFRLMKSGHQGGMDGANDPPANSLSIGFEGKKFGSAQSVQVAEVRRKIYDAREHAGLDLWVLATTTGVNQTDLKSYRLAGEENGIVVEVIDASDHEDRPSALALLAAAAPRSVEAHLGTSPEIVDYLSGVRAASDYADRSAMMLEPFQRPDVGYASARLACARWLEKAFTDDQIAIAHLHCYGGIDAPGRKRVSRPSVNAALDSWWGDHTPHPLVVLGEEGVGKTWSFLAWWQEKMAATPEALPLTLFAPARGLIASVQEKPERFLARLLADRIPGHDDGFWARRLRLWTREKAKRPDLLLVIDGLNQEVTFTEWHRVAQALLAVTNGHVAVVMTCRTHYWQVDLKSLATLTPAPHPVVVGDFDDDELDDMLKAHDVQSDRLTEDLIKLMRVPRYCELAIRRRRELTESGDVTIERLIYEDWAQRLKLHGSNLAPTVEDFHAFLAAEGEALREAIDDDTDQQLHMTKAAIIQGLGSDSGAGTPELKTALSEIISGHWVDEVPGFTSRFRLKRERVPFALALALVAQLDDAGALRSERLAEFMEPLRGTDRGVDILRWAVTVTLLREVGPVETFHLLAHDWFFAQNFGRRDLEALARLIPARPDYFLDLAERIWLRRHASSRDENLFIDIFAEAAKFVPFRLALIERVTKWLGHCWADSSRMQLAQRTDTRDAARETTIAQLQARRDAWEQASAHVPACGGVTVTIIENSDDFDGLDYPALGARATGILSMLPRTPFLPAIVSWAAARSISQATGPHEAMGWVLRINPIDSDNTATALIEISRGLIATGDGVTQDAARLLLDMLATPAASEMRALLPAPAPRLYRGQRATVGEAGVIQLPDTIQGRTDDEPLNRFASLRDLAYRPDLTLSHEDGQLLAKAADATDPVRIFSAGLSQDSPDYALQQSMPALARWAPEALTGLVRRIFASAPDRGGETPEDQEAKLLRLAREVERYWPLLDAATHAVFANVMTPMILRELSAGKADHWLHAQISRLAGKTAAEQIALFVSDPYGPNFYTDEVAVLAAPSRDDFETLRPLLAGAHRASWIGYLFSVDRSAMPADFGEAITRGFENDSERTQKEIFSMARAGQHIGLSRAIVATGWRWTPELETYHGAYGSLALVTAARQFGVPDLEERIDPIAWAARLQDHPEDRVALDRFEALVVSALDQQTFPETLGHPATWFNPHAAMRTLVRERGDNLVAALDRLIARGPEHAFGFGSFPVVTALRALMVDRPDDGARIWAELYPYYRKSSWTLSEFERLPFYSELPSMTPHCDRVLHDAQTDQALASVICWAIDGGRRDWILDHMSAGLGASEAGMIARSFTIGRFIDPSPEADAAWNAAITLPVTGWLDGVRANARDAYERSRAAHHWRDRFLSGNDPDSAFATLTLFIASASARSITLLERAIEARGPAGLRPQESAIFNAARHDLSRVSKDSEKGQDKRLYLTDIMATTHAPWRGRIRPFATASEDVQ